MPDDWAAFQAASEEEKLENFDRSTATLIARQLGASSQQARRLADEYGPAFGTELIASQFLPGVKLWSTRCFDYSVQDFFTKCEKSPVIGHFSNCVEDPDQLNIMVFKSFELGRLVAINKQVNRAHIYCPAKVTCFITTFTGLFSDLFGNIYEDHA